MCDLRERTMENPRIRFEKYICFRIRLLLLQRYATATALIITKNATCEGAVIKLYAKFIVDRSCTVLTMCVWDDCMLIQLDHIIWSSCICIVVGDSVKNTILKFNK